jgi:AbrB family looped-hinge helix DNA binding protein
MQAWRVNSDKTIQGDLNLAHPIDHNSVLQDTDRWRNAMTAVTVSPKYQVVIPKNVRESMGIQPGQKIQMLVYKGRIELIPLQPIEELRGLLKGITTTVEREPDRL